MLSVRNKFLIYINRLKVNIWEKIYHAIKIKTEWLYYQRKYAAV